MSNSQHSEIRPTFLTSTAFPVTVTRRGFLAGSGAAAALALGGSRAGIFAAQNGAIEVPTGPTDLILQMNVEGGLVPPQSLLLEMPLFSLFGDGLVVTQGPTTLQFPGPALPNLLASRLSPEGIQAVLAEARSAGLLGEDIFLRTDMVADAGTTTFTTTANGETTVVSAYALGPEVPPGVTGSVADMYRKLAEFQAKLNTLQDWLPDGGIAEEENPYEITRLQIVAMPVDSLQIPLEPTGDPVPWPLDTPLGELGLPLAETDAQLGTLPEFGEARCAVFEGDAAATLVDALNAANSQTEWESEGATYALFPRPLLPNEAGCGEPVTDGGTPTADATPEA